VPPRDMDTGRSVDCEYGKMVGQYAGGGLEPLTYLVLKRELGEEDLAGFFYIPYHCIVLYMRAVMHGASRNYKEAISLYNELKLCLRPIEDERIASEVYIPLYRAYLKTDRKKSAQTLVDEVSQLFPGSQLEALLRNEVAE